MRRRKGRGRLSSIELLPAEAGPIVAWAMQELKDRGRQQLDILEEFNARLGEIGLGPISKSAFNRHALRLATTARRLEEARAIAATLTERLQPGETDDLTITVAETLKTLVFEMLEGTEEGRGINPKGAMELARALQAAVSAQSISAERRRRIEKDFASKASKVVEKIAKETGLSAGQVAQIRRDVLGVRA